MLVKKARIPDEVEGGRIRVYEVNGHKFSRELPRDYSVISMSDYTTFYAERVPEEELHATDDNSFISVFHFQNEPSRAHGVPFKFLLQEVCRREIRVAIGVLTDTGAGREVLGNEEAA